MTDLSPRCQAQTGIRPRLHYNAVMIPEAVICPHPAVGDSKFCDEHVLKRCAWCSARLDSTVYHEDDPVTGYPLCGDCCPPCNPDMPEGDEYDRYVERVLTRRTPPPDTYSGMVGR